MGGGGRIASLRDQRAELRALQDLRHQGSQSEHHLGSARGGRRSELSKYVSRAYRVSTAALGHGRAPTSENLLPAKAPLVLHRSGGGAGAGTNARPYSAHCAL